jgi:hypothetical protein
MSLLLVPFGWRANPYRDFLFKNIRAERKKIAEGRLQKKEERRKIAE